MRFRLIPRDQGFFELFVVVSVDREPARLIDRRAVFLFGSALVSLLLVPVSPPIPVTSG
jgi:hypothetical protein